MANNFRKLKTFISYVLELISISPVSGKPSVLHDSVRDQDLIEIIIAIHSRRRLMLLILVSTSISLGIIKYKTYRKNKKKLK